MIIKHVELLVYGVILPDACFCRSFDFMLKAALSKMIMLIAIANEITSACPF